MRRMFLLLAMLISFNLFAKPLTFCVTGDSRGKASKNDNLPFNKKIIEKLIKSLNAEGNKPKFILFNGDLVSGYSKQLKEQLTAWRDNVMKPLLDEGIKVYVMRGNHDQAIGWGWNKPGGQKALDAWNEVFSGKYAMPQNGPEGEKGVTYYVKEGNTLCFVLDPYKSDQFHSVNYKWVAEVLEKYKNVKDLHVIVTAHEPVYSAAHKDCLATVPKKRDKLLDVITAAGGVAYFCGHDHFYNHAQIDFKGKDYHQFICGTAGAPLKNWKPKYREPNVKSVKFDKGFGYMIVEVNGKKASMVMKSWPEAGEKPKNLDKKTNTFIIDSFEYTLKK